MAVHLVSQPLSYGDVVFPASIVRETSAPGPPKRKLLDQVREAMRPRQYSRRTEESYVGWIRRFIVFHGKRHPIEMGEASSRRSPSGPE